VTENQKKAENIEIKEIVHHSTCKRRFRNGINVLLRRPDARGSADIVYRVWWISLLCGGRGAEIAKPDIARPDNSAP